MEAVNPLVMYARANDGEAIDQANILQLKENFVRAEMRAREETFTEKSKLKIFCGTWNVNGKRPPDSLVDWLGLQREAPPDVVAVGFQELDLTPEALLLGDTSRSAPWEQMILSTLNTIDSYYLIKSRQLVGMLLCVYVKTALLPKVSDVRTAAAGVGIMGMMGNKGGVGIRFNIYDSSICIVNSHLSAHQEQFQRRNQDFHEICKRVTFENPYGASVTTIFEHDYLFWVGDLNYRLNLPDAEIKALIKESKWDQLLQSDQLTIQMQQGNVFKNFSEARVAFIPTYKYDPGTNTFDTSEKKRSPAWCDRVLWKGSNVEVLEYRRHEQLSSDHRPVSLTTLVQVKNIIQEKRQQVYQEVVKELDKMENQIIPDATLSANDVSFEDVRYGIACSQTVILENTGHVRVRFRFIPKPGEARMTKQWLNVNPPFGTAVPGERIKLELTVLVDEVSAPGLNFGSETLSDILILHLDGGKHYYLHVRGNYLPSCFGSSLEFLVRNPLPIRVNSPLAADNKQVLSIPKELWQIVDFLYKNGMETVHLFLESGVASEMDSIRECLDTGVPLDDYTGSIYSMGESLIRFLESLVEPVIPFSMYNRCIEASGSFSECKQLLSYLSTVNYNVFFYLMAFLREVLNCSPKNRLAPNKLAVVFSTVLIRPPTTDFNETMAKKKAKVDFISYFLRPEDELRLPQ